MSRGHLFLMNCIPYAFYSTLQHSAPHCNTPHHTATLHITLQHSAPHYNTPHHTATLRVTLKLRRFPTRSHTHIEALLSLTHTHCNITLHYTLTQMFPDGLFFSGGKDGYLRFWNPEMDIAWTLEKHNMGSEWQMQGPISNFHIFGHTDLQVRCSVSCSVCCSVCCSVLYCLFEIVSRRVAGCVAVG